jgi:integrase
VAQPRSKFDRFVLPEVLVEAGLALIQEAEDSRTMTKLGRAYQFRNGLMVALLAFCPIRRKNFAALEIGRSFIKNRDKWWIILSAAETKERRADERPVDELLTPIIDRYLAQHHPVLARSIQPGPRVWLSAKNGAPLPDIEITAVIQRTTLATVGMPLGPHMFRTSAASGAALHASDNPDLGSAVLHHTDPRVTSINYNRATCLSAAKSFLQVIRQYEKK